MIHSINRIIAIGRVTLTEAVRQKVLSVLFLFAIILVACSVFISGIAPEGLDHNGLFLERIKFVKDAGCGAMSIIGLAIALFSTALLIPNELQSRTIYTILAKPVRRGEFLLGKFFGVGLLLALFVSLMSIVFAATLYWQETVGVSEAEQVYARFDWHHDAELKKEHDHDIAQIYQQTRDPQLVEAVLLIFAKLVMAAAMALVISTFATSPYFTLIAAGMLYLIAHMEGSARAYWLSHGAETTIWQSALLGFITLLIPDMNAFTIVDEILAGNHIPWSHTLDLLGYAGVYVTVLMGVSVVIFDYREI